MNAHQLIDEARRHGARLRVNGDRLRIEAPAPLPDPLLLQLRAHKSELLALLAANQTSDHDNALDWYAERAAIQQFDGGLSQGDAEHQARRLTRARYGLPDDYRLH